METTEREKTSCNEQCDSVLNRLNDILLPAKALLIFGEADHSF